MDNFHRLPVTVYSITISGFKGVGGKPAQDPLSSRRAVVLYAVWVAISAILWPGCPSGVLSFYYWTSTYKRVLALYSLLLTTCEAAWYIISVVSVCLFVCQTITVESESLDVGSLYLHIRYIPSIYGSSSYMKVIGSCQCHQSKKK